MGARDGKDPRSLYNRWSIDSKGLSEIIKSNKEATKKYYQEKKKGSSGKKKNK